MTAASELSRWDALLEREAEGEPLSADDRAFIADYAARNPEAAQELELLRALGGALQQAARGEAPGDRELIARVFEQNRAEQRAKVGRGTLAVGLALAAGLALWWARPHAMAPAERTSLPPALMQLAAPAVGVTLDGALAEANATVRQGQRIETHEAGACFRFDRNVRACFAPRSVARVTSLGTDALLSLEQGAVAAELEHQVVGASFGLQTGSVVMRAVGTRFGLQIASGSFLSVGAGTVEVTGDGPVYRVAAPSRTELGTHRIAALTADERQALDQLFNPGNGASTAAVGATEAAPRQVSASASAESPVARGASAAAPPSASASGANAGELLARARAERAVGAMNDAAKSYRRLIGEYPSSAEALTARVALGQLELSALGDASGALGHFSEYLRRGGPLEQEARYGQVRALAALGRSADEKQAIEGFLAKYPRAMQSAALQQRLKTLGSATLKK